MASTEIPAIEGGSKTREDFLVFGKPCFEQQEIDEVIAVLKSGWVGTGPRAAQFEREFSTYLGVSHAIALNSCTAAIHLALQCLDLKSGDEVIVPAMTFCATANAVIHAGGIPRFADVDHDSLCVTAKTLEKALSPKTRAILVVHFAGRSAAMDEIVDFASKHQLKIIEDCAHAIETKWDRKHAGTFGWAGCFSFYATKNVSCGEGGMLVTSDRALADRVRKLSLHGLSRDAFKRFTAEGYQHYSHEEYGYKYNMPDLAAAIGLHQLRRIDENYRLRLSLWMEYMDGLKDLSHCTLPPAIPSASSENTHALHLFQIRVPDLIRDRLLAAYAAEGIGVGVHYLALTQFPIYQPFIKLGQTFKNAEAISKQTISLPMGTAMKLEDVTDAVRATKKLLRYYKRFGHTHHGSTCINFEAEQR